ncbi:hypothetical protein PFAG_04572 [Plasmodium falciparum Santa Lucia]|uniref:Uncharacterized protein n=4 Tax=Plasmodium falciparum TaxID=5833 RepID=W4IYY2_PLAFP|nr:hypothetical protein PFFVO_04177 [Plasmodium falciparum Vietnam Oak-Knoll (FVO)]ETW41104.1 hypothetical protein PFNF135_04738 [Plasmodium falciparum NF135/5.C10]ETW54546.1 hypothetical protein PFUGPA_03154 [Plasmodium falciparum Palo Alto/Uganda]EUT81359.1 hypothetical protein PFAG_04572 [Plasmodium falciparum Santa Lucia]
MFNNLFILLMEIHKDIIKEKNLYICIFFSYCRY